MEYLNLPILYFTHIYPIGCLDFFYKKTFINMIIFIKENKYYYILSFCILIISAIIEGVVYGKN